MERVIEFAPISAPPSWLDRVLRGSDLSSIEHSGQTWSFDIGAHCRITTESLWRVITSGGIKVTREDQGQMFGRTEPTSAVDVLAQTLTGPIWSVRIAPLTGDLRIDFREAALEIVTTSSGYEAWHLTARLDGENLELIGMGGGKLAAPRGQRG